MRTFSTGSHRPLEDHNSNRGADGTEVFAAPCFRLRPWTMGPEPASVGPNAPGSAGIIQRRREIPPYDGREREGARATLAGDRPGVHALPSLVWRLIPPWALQDLNLRPSDYESAALTN